MEWKIPLSNIIFGEEEISSVNDVLRSGWLSMGPFTQQFEQAFAEFLGIKYAFAVSNGTAALHIAHRVAGISNYDEVITPSLTFIATSNAVLYCGGKPVFADIVDSNNLNISYNTIQEKITSRTKAITVVHYGGYSCDMDPIMELAEDHDLFVIEDAAHAVGAEYKGKNCGTIGNVGCFSFFANKNLVTGEGGMIVTNNDEIAEKIKLLRSHGMTTQTWDRHKGNSFNYNVNDLGYNYRINEIASALGLIQLKKLQDRNFRRNKLSLFYRKLLSDMPYIDCPFATYKGKSAYHIFPVLLSEEFLRRDFMIGLKKKSIQTSIHYPPIHLFKFYRNYLGSSKNLLPKTEYIGNHEVTLPLFPTMSYDNIQFVCDSIESVISNLESRH